ncbi:MAG: N-6 DNA methylase [Flavobacterium piscis]|nr:N-6 DNA methylase [Flavobacterium piscis]
MAKKVTEQRARQVAKELLKFRGWSLDNFSKGGQCLEENEYKNYKHLQAIFKGKSKTGKGDGYPDFLLVNSSISQKPILVLETKATSSQINEAINDAIHYSKACLEQGHEVIAVGVAGGDKEICSVQVKRLVDGNWINLTLEGNPIDWIPSPEQTQRLIDSKGQTEVQAEKPSNSILAEQAERLNEILRECKIKDEYRPVYIATFMLGLWQGDVSIQESVVLNQINSNAQQAIINAGKPALQNSLRIDSQNNALSARAWEIIDILKKVNIRSFIREHDYLGQLYETFFRYTGGNTIGQYFTPRHVIDLICEIIQISPTDKVLDPACGTGGFLIGALNKMVKKSSRPYEEAVNIVKDNLFGIESEPSTAALCITNMILRGDGKSGVIKDNCFTNKNYPSEEVDFVLMNPPFPHKKTDTPATDFIDRGLKGLKKRGILASIVPYSLLVNTTEWHKKTLKNNTLYFVATLPFDVFQPYASYDTAILMLQKGIPHENKKVFMCRIFNDGFKVKKKNRIEREGSQIPEIIEAFNSKTEIAELTAYPLINANSEEWAPENYIQNKIHSDLEFVLGLEDNIRKQASFYIANGSKIIGNEINNINPISIQSNLFSQDTQISINQNELGEVLLSDYFDVELGGKDEIEDLEDGNFPIVSTSEFMNGVTTWKKPKKIFSAPSITVATDGSVCSSFVQEFPYYAFYKVAILTPKKNYKNIDVDSYYYFAYLLSRERWRYVYARKFGKGRINKTKVIVPITKAGKPDFQKMGDIIRKTRAFPIIKFFRDNSNIKK